MYACSCFSKGDNSEAPIFIDSHAAGLVQREADGADRRIMRLSMTAKGEKACSGINRENDRFFASIFERIPASQRKSVQSGLRVFVEHMAAEMIAEKGKKNKQCKSG